MRNIPLSLVALLASCAALCGGENPEKTSFQTSNAFRGTLDMRADIAMVYGTGPADGEADFVRRMQSWRDQGYETQFMTGIAWGGYEDYFDGRWDGQKHESEGQTDAAGKILWHHPGVPYIMPAPTYVEYMKQRHVKRAIDAGATAIYLEEPEFWMSAGYSPAFKRAWEEYYKSPWRAPHESPGNTWLANRLKYYLYRNALKEVFEFAKAYGKSKGRDIRCYVPTHSLVNYTAWRVVSPEASLALLDCVDGYIAQVWTGTARTPNRFNGVLKERTLENAYLEYACMVSMTAPTERKIYLLTDPVEDCPRDWADYKKNYERTFTAQLLQPEVADYQVMPWPGRIYEGRYQKVAGGETEGISPAYAAQMQIMLNALNAMPKGDGPLDGSAGVRVAMSDTMLFQRFPEHAGYSDPELSNFYGLTLPLLKRGVPLGILNLENISYEGSRTGLRVLLLSYSNMKPPSAETNREIADWVKAGGALVYAARDDDPFQSVPAWWNEGAFHYKAPSQHLFELLGLGQDPAEGEYAAGKGRVRVFRKNPAEFVAPAGADAPLMAAVRALYEGQKGQGSFVEKNYFTLRRGPYLVAAVMDEGVSETPLVLEGRFIDLFDPNLPVIARKELKPDMQTLLYDLDRVKSPDYPQILAGGARAYDEVRGQNSYAFTARGPDNTPNVMRVRLPAEPTRFTATDKDGKAMDGAACVWDKASRTALLTMPNRSSGVHVTLEW